MENYKIELRTMSELKIGDTLILEIKQINNMSSSLGAKEEMKVLCVSSYVGRRLRVLGYVDTTLKYGNLHPEQLISVMDENNLEKIEVQVFKNEEKIDGRHVYLLIIKNEDVLFSLSKTNSSVVNTVESIMGNLELTKTEDVSNVTSSIEVVEKPVKELVEGELFKKVDEDEIKEIVLYLASNDIPEKYINKIIKSHIGYPSKYLERIPTLKDGSFVPWKYDGVGENLLKLAIISVEMGKNLRFVGGKGAGKNTLLSTLSWVYQRPLFSQSANRDTDITHLFGDKTINPINVDGQVVQTVEFEKGLLVEAMEIGGFYEFGEGNACRPEVTMALHSVLDSRREADVNGYKLVKANKNFAFVLTMNVDYEGCNSLNQAFRDRFITISFSSPNTIVRLLKQSCPLAKDKDIEVCDKLYKHILSRVSELQTDEIVTIRGYMNALDLAGDLGLKTALKICVAHNVSDDEFIVQEILEIIDNLLV